jgi:hypothetical protein
LKEEPRQTWGFVVTGMVTLDMAIFIVGLEISGLYILIVPLFAVAEYCTMQSKESCRLSKSHCHKQVIDGDLRRGLCLVICG